MTLATVDTKRVQNTALGLGDHLRFGKLLLDRCGLYFSERRRAELELGIRHAFAASTCASLDEYYNLLQTPDGAVEMDRLINAVTVNETHFFRDAAQFDALYRHVLPQLIERRRSVRTLRIWSAGCASGEEPYSIAMLLRELLPDVDEWAITILGTDINTEALNRARRAQYGEWAFREARARQWRPRYFTQTGNRYELSPQVKRMVTFARLNLAEPVYPSYQTNTTLLDLILCRNVTIYFSEQLTTQVAERFYNALVEGGWLVVGHSEPSLTTYRRFQTRNFPDTILYQRDGGAQPAAFSFQPSPPSTSHLSSPISISPLPSPTFHLIPATPPQAEQIDPLEHAQELLEYGRSEDACAVLLEALQARPADAPLCALLGQAYANLGRWQEAERWCQQAIQLDRLALDAYYTLALVLQHQGRLVDAIDAMKKVVYIDRNYILGHFGLADLYHENHQLPQALKSLDNTRRLLNGDPSDRLIPGSGGITVGRLQETVIRQQQAWAAA